LKHALLILFLVLGIYLLGGCSTVSKSPKNTTSSPRGETFPLLPPENVELSPVIANLDRSGGLTFSTDGILYFANHLQSGTIGMYQVDRSQSAETFIDLTQWMTSYGDRTPRAHGMRIDRQGRLVVAEAGTGKVIRISPEAETDLLQHTDPSEASVVRRAGKLEVLADSFDGFSLGSVCDVVIGPDGDIYASSPTSGAVFIIRPEDGYVGMLNQELARVRGLAISPDGRRLVAAEPEGRYAC
jgi:sugar lactone lactonase YvrE